MLVSLALKIVTFATVNWNRKPIVPPHLAAVVLIAVGSSAALASFVIGEGYLPLGIVLFTMGIFILFSRWVKND